MQAGDKLNFIEPLTLDASEVTVERAQAAQQVFRDLFVKLLVGDEKALLAVKLVQPNGVSTLMEAAWRLDAPDGSYLYVVAYVEDTGEESLPDGVVQIAEHSPAGAIMSSHAYSIEEGRGVTRRDVIIDPKDLETHPVFQHFSFILMYKALAELSMLSQSEWDADREVAESAFSEMQRIEEEGDIVSSMGLNNQPVDAHELQSLAELLADAQPVEAVRPL